MKVSIVTVVFNCVDFLEDCIRSVQKQNYHNIEHIVIDGGSTDGTISIIEKYREKISYFSSEPDDGIYDALNKGIKVATGELIGALNADDQFAGSDVLTLIVKNFVLEKCDAVYGNLNFISRNNQMNMIRRKWRSCCFRKKNMLYGWMPAHPTLYIRRSLFDECGLYSLNFGSSADYELMLRLFYRSDIKSIFVNKLMILMREGGVSNGSVYKVYAAICNDYRALVFNDVPRPLLVLLCKKVRKLKQFF